MSELFTASLRAHFRNRGALIGPLVLIFILYLVELSFWNFTAQSGSFGAYDRYQLLEYVCWSVLVFQIVAISGVPDSIVFDIESGDIEQTILRPQYPVAYFAAYHLGQVTSRAATYSPLAVGLLIYFRRFDISDIVGFVSAVAIGALVNVLLNTLMSCLAFRFSDSYAFIAVKDTLIWMLSGALLPLDLLPPWVQKIMLLLPFQYIAFVPAKIISGQMEHPGFFLACGLAAVAVMGLLTATVWRGCVRGYQGYGG